MAKKSVTSLVERIERKIPQLSFTAYYDAEDPMLLASMRMYRDRPFVYVLAIDVGDREEVIYVGQSVSQYARMIQHLLNYGFSKVYLFSCDGAVLNEAEAKAIRMLSPLFNRRHNPKAVQYQRVLNIEYDVPHDRESILHYLSRWKEYCDFGLYGFALPPVLFSMLKREASNHKRTVSEEMVDILEALFADEIHTALEEKIELPKSNLLTAENYAAQHSRSVEQAKQYLHQDDRLTAQKIGRDWVVIEDLPWPLDRRERMTSC